MTTLTIPEAVRLCTAWADRLARDHGVRALVIKGHVLSAQGLREGYESVDVDLLVEPADHDRFLEVLGDHGWTPMTLSTAPKIIPLHAVTVTHLWWPITIDVHRHFPGFLADPQVVFDVLWQRSTTARVAGIEVRAPDPIGHAALVALHHLRSPDSSRAASELPDLTARVRATLTPEQVQDLAALAARTGASATLAPFLEDLGAQPAAEDDTDAEALAAWRLRTSVPESAWLVGLSRVPVWRWPLDVWHAIWLSDAEVETYHRRGAESLTRARWRRFSRGLLVTPPALARLARHKLARRRPRRHS